MATKVNLDVSEKLNITCKKGDTFTLSLLMKDSDGDALDVSGYRFLMQVKGEPDPDTGIRPLIIGTSDRGKLAQREEDGFARTFNITSTADGNVTIIATAAVMAEVPAGSYIYDIQQEAREIVTTIFEGRFVVNDDVSNYAD